MKRQWSSRMAWGALAGYGVVSVLAPLLITWMVFNPGHSVSLFAEYWVFSVLLLPSTAVGVLIAARRPENIVGWVLLTVGFGWNLQIILEVCSNNRGAIAGRPLAEWLIWLNTWVYVPPLVLIFTALPLMYPTGRLPSPRWRPVVWLTIISIVLWTFESAYGGDEPSVELPSAVASPTLMHWAGSIDLLVAVTLASAAIGGVLSIIMRFLRARGIERQQIKWFMFVIAILTAAVLLSGVGDIDDGPMWQAVASVSWMVTLATTMLGLPLAIGIAVFRYRLYEIDRIINRTLVYTALTACLLAVYLGLIVSLGAVARAITGQGSDLVVATSTLGVAALFRPLRSRIQSVVDQRFYRKKYDAAQALDEFSGRLRNEIDLATLCFEFQDVVKQTVQPATVSVWLRGNSERTGATGMLDP